MSLYKKSGKTKEQIFHKVQKNPNFGHFWAQIGPIKFFFEKIFSSQLAHFYSTSLYKKSGKTNEPNFHKGRKTLFLGIFGPKLAQKFFFSKIFFVHN